MSTFGDPRPRPRATLSSTSSNVAPVSMRHKARNEDSSSHEANENRRSFSRATGTAWEKFTNVIRKPSHKDPKDKEKRIRDMEPRMASVESGVKAIGEQLEEMKKQNHQPGLLTSASCSNLQLPNCPVNSSMEELSSTKEELAATMAELKEVNDRHVRLQHQMDCERRAREEAERELTALRTRLAEGSIPFIDSEAPVHFPASTDRAAAIGELKTPTPPRKEAETETWSGVETNTIRELWETRTRLAGVEAELEKKTKEYEVSVSETRKLLTDMLVAVKVAQTCREEAETDLKRYRDAHRPIEAEDDSEVWAALKRGREGASRRNALLAWARETLATHGFPHVTLTNFSSSWSDGRALAALVAIRREDLVKREDVDSPSVLSFALSACSALALPSFTPDMLTNAAPDWRTVLNVVVEIYRDLYFTSAPHRLPPTPEE